MMTTTPKPAARRVAASLASLALTVGLLAACSSDDTASEATDAVAPASSAAAGAGEAGTPEMQALCDEMVAGALSPEDATALAEQNGYVARVGSIDGEGQAVTMDYREDRFTFEVEGGAVIGCTYG